MSFYHYDNKLWTLKVPMRESNFTLFQSISPNSMIEIVDREYPHRTRRVRAGDLTSYSVQRNLNALQLNGKRRGKMNYEIKKKEEFDSNSDYWRYLSELFSELEKKKNEIIKIKKSIRPNWIKELKRSAKEELDL